MEQAVAKDKMINDKNIEISKLKQSENNVREQNNKFYIENQNARRELEKKNNDIQALQEEKQQKAKRYQDQIKDLQAIINLLKQNHANLEADRNEIKSELATA